MLPSVFSLAARSLVPATRAGRLVVLIYHRVRPVRDEMFPDEVETGVFREQMRLLRDHVTPLPLREAIVKLGKGTLPSRACAVTFDDGYADNAKIALPILKECGVPATFFVATGFLDGGRMWNDSVIEAIRRAPAGTLDLSRLGMSIHQLAGPDSRRAAALALIRTIKHLPLDERQSKVDGLCELLQLELPNDLMMTGAQVRELADAGMEIGGHTVHHPVLRTLDDVQAREEIVRNRAELERIIGAPVAGFAYPNGRPKQDYTQRDRELVEALGFEYAVSTARGCAHRASDPFQLPRFTPWDRTPARWLARLLLEYRNPG